MSWLLGRRRFRGFPIGKTGRPAFCSAMVPVRSSFWARMRRETAATVAYWLIACILTAVIMIFYVDGGPSATQTVGHLRMEGPEVFKHAVKNLSSVIGEALKSRGSTLMMSTWLVSHQANKRIISSTARKLRVGEEKIVMTVERHANTSAASIPLARMRSRSRWADQYRRCLGAGSYGRWFYLGRKCRPLVIR